MRKQVLQILAMLFAVSPIVSLAQAPKDGVYITDDDIKAVLKHSADTHRTIPDNTLKVIDMGQYQLGVAVVARGAMKAGGGANANVGGGNAAPAAAANAATACGEAWLPCASAAAKASRSRSKSFCDGLKPRVRRSRGEG